MSSTNGVLVRHIGGCDDCSARWTSRNVLGIASQHAKKYKHKVWVETSHRYEINGNVPLTGRVNSSQMHLQWYKRRDWMLQHLPMAYRGWPLRYGMEQGRCEKPAGSSKLLTSAPVKEVWKCKERVFIHIHSEWDGRSPTVSGKKGNHRAVLNSEKLKEWGITLNDCNKYEV